MEPDFNRLVPEGITVHSARLKTIREASFETLSEMEKLIIPAALSLKDCEVDAICYGCTSGSFIEGPSFNERIEENIKKETGIPAVTTTTAMVESLQGMGIKKVAVVTPYVRITNDRLVKYLDYYGIKTVSLRSFDMIDQYEHANISSCSIYRLARQANVADADGVFISCTQIPAIDVAEALESDLGKPVIAATAAAMWLTMKRAGVRIPLHGYGAIMWHE
jgi:maleate cis-trans isomerase